MKVSIDRVTLKKAVDVVSITLGTKDTNEWSKGIKVEAKDGKAILSSTDMTISSQVEIDATVENEGKFLINGNLFSKLLECYTGNTIEFEVGENIKIKSGRDKGEFEPMRLDDFSFIDAPETNSWFKIPIELLSIAKDKVGFATAKGDMKPKFSSINFSIENNGLSMVATDGTRLAIYKTDVPEGVTELDILFVCDLLGKVLNGLKTFGVKNEIEMLLQTDKIFFRSEGVFFSSSLVNDKYFNYSKIIPKNQDIKFVISVDNKELARTIKIAKIANDFSPDPQKQVGIKGTEEGFGEGSLSVINAGGSNKQSGEISYTAESGEVPKEFCLWVSSEHMLEILSKLGDVVELEVDRQDTPFKIKTKGSNDDYFVVVMPKARKKSEGA